MHWFVSLITHIETLCRFLVRKHNRFYLPVTEMRAEYKFLRSKRGLERRSSCFENITEAVTAGGGGKLSGGRGGWQGKIWGDGRGRWIFSLKTSAAQETGHEHSHFPVWACQFLHNLVSFPLSNPFLAGSHEWVGLQGTGLSCVGAAAGKSEQSTAVSVPLFCLGPLVVVFALYTELQSNPVAVLSFDQLVEIIDLPLGYLFLPNITWPTYLCSEPTSDHKSLVHCSPKGK